MRVLFKNYALEIELQENKVVNLVIENAKAFSEICQDLWKQVNGEAGNIILSDNEKVKSISKEVDCIFNPFSLKCNDKKILTKIYQEISKEAEFCLQDKMAEVNSKIVEFVEQLISIVPYDICFEPDMDITGLLKLYNVAFEDSNGSLLEKIVEYIRIMSKLCGIKVFVFINLKQYLDENELMQLYEFCFYEKIYIINLEAYQDKIISSAEKYWIIDKDFCIIDVEN